MDDMREIVTVEQVEAVFRWLAIGAPILGVLIGAGVAGRRGAARRGAVVGLALGLLGPANLALWRLYNAITNHLGLDTVRNLLTNMALFVGLGAAAGVAYGLTMRRRMKAATAGPSPAGAVSGRQAEASVPAAAKGGPPGGPRQQDSGGSSGKT
jgi:hypothetical protein